ncbi:MAG: ribosome maturation factor RimM [Anaerolineae bacterium]|nr:ribosome maturation factor RimM [Anaerolineae bacterium]
MGKGTPEPRFLVVGRIVRPHGVRGEMRVEILTELPERLTWLEQVFLSRDPDDPAPEVAVVERVRLHKGQALVQLEDVHSREAAEDLRSVLLLVPLDDALPLEDDEYYFYQLEGLEVVTDEGEILGVLREVLETGANEVFVVAGSRGDLLLPNTLEVVQDIDLESGRITVHILPGLL